MPDPERHAAPRLHVLIVLASLCVAATWYFCGDLGHFNDDYFYDQRDVATGEIRALVLDRHVHVWRPLFRVIVPTLHTLFWEHNWVLHTISTLTHLLVCWLLYTLLVRLGASARAGLLAAAAFAVYPGQYEAVFWSCCIPTLLATALLLAMCHLHVSWARMPPDRPRGAARLWPLVFGSLAFAVAALNEQPAGPLAALPILAWIAADERLPLRRRLLRAIVPAGACGGFLVVYLVGHFRHVSAGVLKQDGESPVERFGDRIRHILHNIPGELGLHDFGAGALSHGWEVVCQHPGRSVVCGAVLLAALGGLIRAWCLAPGRAHPRSGAPRSGMIGIAVVAAAWYVAAWLPICFVHDATSPRLHYVPDLSLAMLLAACMTGLEKVMRPRLLGAVALWLAVLPAVVVMIGVQDGYRLRFERDLKEADALAATAGAAVEPGTIFVPMQVDSDVLHTQSSRFNRYFQACWNWEYAAGWHLQQRFRRNDVHVVLAGYRTWMTIYDMPGEDPDATPREALLVGRIARPLPQPIPPRSPYTRGRILGWSRVVPFGVASDGTVHIYTRVDLMDDQRTVLRSFVPRQVQRILDRAPQPAWFLPLVPAPPAYMRPRPVSPDSSAGTSPAPRPR